MGHAIIRLLSRVATPVLALSRPIKHGVALGAAGKYL